MGRSAEDIILSVLVDALRPRLVGLVVGKYYETMDEPAKVVFTSFADLHEITECLEFPNGLDFTSRTGSDRSALYNCRVALAQEGCWFSAEWGEGLNWTADPILGIRWFNDMQMEKAENRAEKATHLWHIAQEKAPARLHSILGELADNSKWFRARIADAKSTASDKLDLIESGYATKDHAFGVTVCSTCGDDLRRGDRIEPDGEGGFRHKQRCPSC